MKSALSIAGFDPSGSAGLLVDGMAMRAAGARPLLVVAGLTAQSEKGVRGVFPVPGDFVLAQLEALDSELAAAKTGALFSAEIVATVSEFFRTRPLPLVVDPVLVSSSGFPLLEAEGRDALVHKLLPLTTLLTPNTDEVRALTGIDVKAPGDMAEAAEALADLGPRAVLVKGGHLEDPVDLLWFRGETTIFRHARKKPRRGTGCALSGAVAGRLALGEDLPRAVAWAVRWLQMRYLRAG